MMCVIIYIGPASEHFTRVKDISPGTCSALRLDSRDTGRLFCSTCTCMLVPIYFNLSDMLLNTYADMFKYVNTVNIPHKNRLCYSL